MKRQATTIYEALSQIDPAGADYYRANLEGFCQDLDALDQWIRPYPRGSKDPKLHGLSSLLGGIMPTPMIWYRFPSKSGLRTQRPAVGGVNWRGQEKRVKAIFVQSQINAKSAAAVARAVGAKVVQLDPLAEDYLENLRQITLSLYQALAE